MTSYETILLQEESGVATLTVNRPDKLNALDSQVLQELAAALDALSEPSREIRAAIVTGAGDRAFIAGADIAAMSRMTPAEGNAFSALGHSVCDKLEGAPFPVIAAVNGFALGGGTELALACDFIYASEKARFGQPEVGLGLMPGFGGTQRLARRVGLGHARELIFTGDPIFADRAQAIGLVNTVTTPDELMPAARKTARTIASRAPLAVRASKRAILRGADPLLATGCELEIQAFGALFGTDDQREGTSAFLEKRIATFKGR